MVRPITAIALAVALSGCATTHWAPPVEGTNVTFEQQSARCRLFANGTTQGVIAFGSAAFVGGAMLGNAIANAVRVYNNHKDCMLASGWRAVQPPTAGPARPVTTTVEK